MNTAAYRQGPSFAPGAKVAATLLMLLVTKNFLTHRIHDALGLLAQDGITGSAARRRLMGFLLWKPGVLRQIFPSWLAYFLPGFHPWNTDDRGLITQAERELGAADSST